MTNSFMFNLLFFLKKHPLFTLNEIVFQLMLKDNEKNNSSYKQLLDKIKRYFYFLEKRELIEKIPACMVQNARTIVTSHYPTHFYWRISPKGEELLRWIYPLNNSFSGYFLPIPLKIAKKEIISFFPGRIKKIGCTFIKK